MPRIYTIARVRRPIEEVFDFVTMPVSWLQWHPSSVRVSGATDHSLAIGETVTEEFLVAGRSGSVTWTVIERDRPRRWTISGEVPRVGGGDIAYTLTDKGDETVFEREFTYHMANRWLALLEQLIARRRIQAESVEAMRRLKEFLESSRSSN